MTETVAVYDEGKIAQDFPVRELLSRYAISRSTLYLRFNKLKIESAKRPTKSGVESFISTEQLALMDKYDLLANQSNAKLQDWLSELEVDSGSLALDNGSSAPELMNSPKLMEVLMTIAQRLPTPTVLQPNLSLKERLETLQAACNNGWLLSTQDVKELIGAGSVPTERYGFRFEKTGKNGRAIAWKVGKAYS